MGAAELNDETLAQSQLLLWQRHHPYLFALTRTFVWFYSKIREALSIIFATWPSMHDPIKYLLNVVDVQEADTLTEKWTKAKLKELQYVGLSSALITGTIASAFSWYSIEGDPWSTEACWTSALVLALTAISLATQQTIGLTRLSSCENGWLKVRRLLGEQDPSYGRRSRFSFYGRRRQPAESKVRMKKSQLWMWQTPVMLSNFAILLFVIGLMISVFQRAVRGHGALFRRHTRVAIFFGCATIFAGVNYLFCWICLNQGSREPSNSETQENHHSLEKDDL